MKKTKILLVGLISLVGLMSLVALNQSNQHRDTMGVGATVREGAGAAPTPSLTAPPNSTRPHDCTDPGCSDSGVTSVTRRIQGQAVNDGEAPSDPILSSVEGQSEGDKIIEGESKAEFKAALEEAGRTAILEAFPRRQISSITSAFGGTWTAQGPGPTRNGQVENIIPNNEVVGAIHTVAAHPTDANILYVGAVNGGVWKTSNATAASPNWTPLTDNFPSLSIGALEFDPTDATRQTLVAGIGRFSSFGRSGGPLTGLLRTTDGGDNWAPISHPLLVQNISGIAARGATLLVAANLTFVGITGGLFRSTDGGINWALVSGSNGLPAGGVFDLVGDPGNLNRFYLSVQRMGIFRSDDGGANWTNISSGDPTLNGIMTLAQNNNAEMAVASNGRLYVVVVTSGRAQYIGFSDNPAAGAPAWTAMDLPRTLEPNGEIEGIHPGGQGTIHLAIVVDRNDPNTVYVSGDRQDSPFPNFIGARDFSGRLFRGDTTVAPTGAVPSPQWEHMTHLNSIAQTPGGGTARGSSPHADSREMVIAANGDLIEVNDGGIYRRTSPQNNTGDWFSINGDIQTTEFHDIAYDTNSNTILIGGAQDTGTPVQLISGSTTWRSVSTADGGDVAVDNITLAALNRSIRYSSFQNLGSFRRETYDANNVLVARVFPARTVVGGGAPLQPQFVTPVELNVINPSRLVIGGSNSVYESLNQGNTITEINGPGANRNAMAYGGRSGGVDNQDVLYVGSGTGVFLRTTAGAPLAPTAALPVGAGTIRDVVLDTDDWRNVFAIDSNQVFRTTNAGASWTDITGNLAERGAGDFQTTEFVAGQLDDLLLIGTNAGVFVSFSSSGFTCWNELGTGLPNAVVWDLDYDVADDVLLAGTLGRGAWTITNLRDLADPPPIITLNPPISLWPPEHNYHTVTVAQMVKSVSDNCAISIGDVVIERVTSDEPDNSLGDGNTSNDIVIDADCRSVQLRAERAGTGDGRVYTVTLLLRDSAGAVTRADFEVSVPHSQNGVPAVKGATAFAVMSDCQ